MIITIAISVFVSLFIIYLIYSIIKENNTVVTREHICNINSKIEVSVGNYWKYTYTIFGKIDKIEIRLIYTINPGDKKQRDLLIYKQTL